MPARVAALCGLVAPVAFVVGLVLGDLAQPDPFDPAHDDISHLGAETASSPWLYNQVGANLTGLLVVGLGLGLWSALGRGWVAHAVVCVCVWIARAQPVHGRRSRPLVWRSVR